MCCDLEVADRRMTPAVKLVLAQPLVAGAPPLVCDRMGNCVLHRRTFTQGGPAALGLKLGAKLLLEWLVLANSQGPAVPEPGFGTLHTYRTRVTCLGRKLGVSPWRHRHSLAIWTGHRPVGKVQGEVVLGKECPILRPRAGNNVHTLRGPLGNPRAGHVPQIDVQLPGFCAMKGGIHWGSKCGKVHSCKEYISS